METPFDISDETDSVVAPNIFGTVNFGEMEYRDPDAIAADAKKELEKYYKELLEAHPNMRVMVLNFRIREDETPDNWWLDYSVEDADGDGTKEAEAREHWIRIKPEDPGKAYSRRIMSILRERGLTGKEDVELRSWHYNLFDDIEDVQVEVWAPVIFSEEICVERALKALGARYQQIHGKKWTA